MDAIASFVKTHTEGYVDLDASDLKPSDLLRVRDEPNLLYLARNPDAWGLSDIMAIREGKQYKVICGGHRMLLMKQGLVPWAEDGVSVHVLSADVIKDPMMLELLVIYRNAGPLHPEAFERVWKALRNIQTFPNLYKFIQILVPDGYRIAHQVVHVLNDWVLSEKLYNLSRHPGYTSALLWRIVEMVDTKDGLIVSGIGSDRTDPIELTITRCSKPFGAVIHNSST
jgi:hypothetical protein